MKKALAFIIALLMTGSILFSVPTSAYASFTNDSASDEAASTELQNESIFMKVVHMLFFSKLTFNTDGGTEIPSQYAWKLFGRFKTPADPVKEGYTFAGWEPSLPTRAPFFGNMSVKAKWKKSTKSVVAKSEEEYIAAYADLFDESVNDEGFDSQEALADPYYMGRLIVDCSDYSLINFERFEAKEIVYGNDGTVVLQFDDRDTAEKCAGELKKLSAIDAVAADAYLEIDDYEIEPITEINTSPDWGVKYINADKYSHYLKNTTKDRAVTVAVLDTGIDADHPYLKDAISMGGVNYTESDSAPQDDHGHGTHVSGIIKQCTDGLNVNILPIKVLKNNGEGKAIGSVKWILNGISRAVQTGADIINLSLEVPANPIVTEEIQKKIDHAISKGCVVVVAAGNGDDKHLPVDTSNVAPANIENAIVVGAIDKNGIRGTFSNYGNSVDVCAPGVAVTSTYLKTDKYPYEYGKLDGTSQAAPHISAVAAMFKYLNEDLKPAEIETLIKKYCVDKGPAGRDDYYGEGCPNMYNAIPDCTIRFNVGEGDPISSTTVKSTSTVVLPNPSKYYKVTFDTCGGTVVNSYNSQCMFGGWFESSSLTGASHPAKESYMVKENGTLYAKWTNKGFESPQNPTRDYYDFAGWYTALNGGTRVTGSYAIEDNITVYARWTLKPEYGWVSENEVPAGAMVTDREYRYRDARYNKVVTNWGAWQVGNNTASETVEIAKIYRYDTFVCSCGERIPRTDVTCKRCGSRASSGSFQTIWSNISYAQANCGTNGYMTSGTYSRYYTTSLGDGKVWYFYQKDLNQTSVGRKANGTGDVVIQNGYRTRTITYNQYWDDNDWSNWSTNVYTASSTRQVQIRVKYRNK